MREDTTIRIKRSTKLRFNKYGKQVGETDDELLTRLFDRLDALEKARK